MSGSRARSAEPPSRWRKRIGAPNADSPNWRDEYLRWVCGFANAEGGTLVIGKNDAGDVVGLRDAKKLLEDLTETFPELNTSNHILVMTDEAHRSQYSKLAANLDKGIPNATRIGYTGTPIDKTEKVFGDYIDKYTMRQAIADGVTLEIIYEGRTHNAEVTDTAGMDAMFKDVFHDYTLPEQLQIMGAGGRRSYLEADTTIAAKAQDMVKHYLTHVFPNGYKAQIVATSREAAVRYKKHVDESIQAAVAEAEERGATPEELEPLKQLKSDVVISGTHNDELHLKAYTDASRHTAAIKSFKLPFDKEDGGVRGDIGIIIVNNMLLTGFDAAVEQVMYLDKIIVNHGLLQAVARVNRVGGDGKDKGFVVDYVGIGHHLKKALDGYDEREQQEVIEALSFPEEELRELGNSHDEIFALLKKHGVTDLTDHDAIYDLFYDEDLRFQFLALFKQFTKNLNLVFPAKEALDYLGDYEALAEVQALASKHLRDGRLSMKGIPPKLRKIVDAYLESKGVDLKVEPISILDEDFQKEVKKHDRVKTKAAEIEHAVRHHLDVEMDDDPELKASFAEALRQILEEFASNWNKIYEELEKLRQRILSAGKEPTYGLHRKKQMPIFRMLRREIFGEGAGGDGEAAVKVNETPAVYGLSEDEKISLLVGLTQELFAELERELALTGFWESIPARNKLVADIQRVLLQPGFSRLPGIVDKRKVINSRLMEIAEKNHDTILYAP